jgi:very-short-patch-repair endonuclease
MGRLRKSDHAYANARRLRRNLSLPEGLLWRELRRRPDGLKFRNQHPLGPYALDFYCAAAKLAIEIDGIAHDMGDRPERDDTRDAFVHAQWIEVVRIPAADVLKSPADVAEAIVALCRERIA